jgi:hypothetical protein
MQSLCSGLLRLCLSSLSLLSTGVSLSGSVSEMYTVQFHPSLNSLKCPV